MNGLRAENPKNFPSKLPRDKPVDAEENVRRPPVRTPKGIKVPQNFPGRIPNDRSRFPEQPGANV